jgi:hypothetical protein
MDRKKPKSSSPTPAFVKLLIKIVDLCYYHAGGLDRVGCEKTRMFLSS